MNLPNAENYDMKPHLYRNKVLGYWVCAIQDKRGKYFTGIGASPTRAFNKLVGDLVMAATLEDN